MKALITGASSGIGKHMAYYLASKNIDLILVARNKKEMEKIKKDVQVAVKIYSLDLTKESEVYKLYTETKEENIDILINNAGFGLFGTFAETNLDRELEMIDLNIKAYHILTKLTMAINEELRQVGSNVSISALCPGPVNTNFNKVAHGEFSIKEIDPAYVAKYAIDKMFKRKMLIIPTLRMKLTLFLTRFAPYRLQLLIAYHIQGKKLGK